MQIFSATLMTISCFIVTAEFTAVFVSFHFLDLEDFRRTAAAAAEEEAISSASEGGAGIEFPTLRFTRSAFRRSEQPKC